MIPWLLFAGIVAIALLSGAFGWTPWFIAVATVLIAVAAVLVVWDLASDDPFDGDL